MKIVFIEIKGTSNFPHNGLALLAGNVGKEKHQVKIFDLNILNWDESKLLEEVKKEKPDLVGFSMKSFNLRNVLSTAKKVKEISNAKLIVGGPHITLCAKDFFANHNENVFDFGFQGEGDISFTKFCDVLGRREEYRNIHGLVYSNNDKMVFNNNDFITDLDRINPPDFDCFAEKVDFEKQEGYPLLTSRGCPYQCIYCSVSKMNGSKWRFRSPLNILKELENAIRKYGIKRFKIIDDNFTLDMNRAKQFCRLLIERNLNLKWNCPNGLRADRLDDELACLMKESGCESVSLGVESGDEKVFNFISKGEKLDDIRNAVKILKKYNFEITGFFIIGLPLATAKSVKQSLKFIDELQLDAVKWNMLIPYPQTFLWDWVSKNGRFLKSFFEGQHFSREKSVQPVFDTLDFTARERVRAYKIANLSTGSISYVYKIPKNKFLAYLKYSFYLLIYNPKLLFEKTTKKLRF